MTASPRTRFLLPAVMSIPYDHIDSEHDAIIALLSDTFDALENANLDASLFESRCAEFRSKLEEHFRHEEQLMESTNFPRLAQHRAHHQGIRDRIGRIGSAGDAGIQGMKEILESLYDAFIAEVLRSDLDFKAHLEGKGLIAFGRD